MTVDSHCTHWHAVSSLQASASGCNRVDSRGSGAGEPHGADGAAGSGASTCQRARAVCGWLTQSVDRLLLLPAVLAVVHSALAACYAAGAGASSTMIL